MSRLGIQEVDTFSEGILKFANSLEEWTVRYAKQYITDLFLGIIDKTPVLTGRAAGNWLVDHFNPQLSLPKPYDGRNRRIGLTVIKGFKFTSLSNPLIIFNNVSYISDLEYGFSKKAPQGMVAVTIAELEAKYGNDAFSRAESLDALLDANEDEGPRRGIRVQGGDYV
jgi:hypothetical protein